MTSIQLRSANGVVNSVKGSRAVVEFSSGPTADDVHPTVGDFLTIHRGERTIVGQVSEIWRGTETAQPGYRVTIASVDLVGMLNRAQSAELRFSRGVADYPGIGDEVHCATGTERQAIHGSLAKPTIEVGDSRGAAVQVSVENTLAKHFAILGSTGVGKSSGVAVILRELLKSKKNLSILLLDVHNEYSECFGSSANVVDVKNFKLPFWVFNFDELTDAIYGGRPPVAEELEILAELIPIAKSTYLNYKASADRASVKRRDPKQTGFTVDTPVPYLLQDLESLIDDRMGRLENRPSRIAHHRLLSRMESLRNNPRYAFMFDGANVGGDTMATLLEELFSLSNDGARVSVLKLASIPTEVIDAVVCVILRLAFEFGLWSNAAKPLLCVCEEAHRFASADRVVGFAPTRRAIARIAKEGRKHGVYLGLVSQRPAELDPTIVSQCSTIFAMRMSHHDDQAMLRSALPDSSATLIDFLPALGTSEVVGLGEGFPLPVRFVFSELAGSEIPRSETIVDENGDIADTNVVRAAVDRWRRAAMNAMQRQDEATAPALPLDRQSSGEARKPIQNAGPIRERSTSIEGNIIEKMREQILKRS